jgi:hypothetical protein
LGLGLVGPREISGFFERIFAVLFLGLWEGCGDEPLAGVSVVVDDDASVLAVKPVNVDERHPR